MDRYIAQARQQIEAMLQHELAGPVAISLLSVLLAVLLLKAFAKKAASTKEAGGTVMVGGVRRSTRTTRQAKLYSEEFVVMTEDPAPVKTPRAAVSSRALMQVVTAVDRTEPLGGLNSRFSALSPLLGPQAPSLAIEDCNKRIGSLNNAQAHSWHHHNAANENTRCRMTPCNPVLPLISLQRTPKTSTKIKEAAVKEAETVTPKVRRSTR